MTGRDPTGGRPACGAVKRGGGTCRVLAGRGTDHPGIGACKHHGGNTPNHRRAAGREIAIQAVQTYGLPTDIAPADALLREIARTNGHVLWLEEQIRALAPEDLVWGLAKRERINASEFSGVNETEAAQINTWVDLYQRERRHLVDVCRVAIAAGIAERQVKIAERQAQLMVTAITASLVRLGLDPTAPEVRIVIAEEIRAVA